MDTTYAHALINTVRTSTPDVTTPDAPSLRRTAVEHTWHRGEYTIVRRVVETHPRRVVGQQTSDMNIPRSVSIAWRIYPRGGDYFSVLFTTTE